jgi:hypothetical protein
MASALRTTRRVVEAIFLFTNRTTGVVEESFTRVDVTKEFSLLETRLSPYYDVR